MKDTEIKGINNKGGRKSMEKTDGQRERGLMGLFEHLAKSWQRDACVATACL